MTGKTLIVEDNQDFRHFLKEQLSETYQVIDAPDGEEGEKLAVEQNPDLIISDIMMPKVDGLELCRRIKHNVQTSHIPVILLTARSGDEAKSAVMRLGQIPIYPNLSALMCYWCVSSSLSSSRRAGRKNSARRCVSIPVA